MNHPDSVAAILVAVAIVPRWASHAAGSIRTPSQRKTQSSHVSHFRPGVTVPSAGVIAKSISNHLARLKTIINHMRNNIIAHIGADDNGVGALS